MNALADLYRRATVGVVFSATNYSLIPHEMMACGLPVVELDGESTRADFLQTLVAGSTIDCVRRSEFIAVGVYQEPTGFRLAVRLPAGRDGFPPEFALHVPPDAKSPGSLPLLEPPGVLYSQSFYLDIGFYWKNRDKLINKDMLKQLEEGEKQLNKILPGSAKLSGATPRQPHLPRRLSSSVPSIRFRMSWQRHLTP